MSTQELPEDSFLAILMKIVEEQDEELQAKFFTGTKEELIDAFNKGVAAAKKRHPQASNPYKETAVVAYSPNLAWNEGWMSVSININNLLKL